MDALIRRTTCDLLAPHAVRARGDPAWIALRFAASPLFPSPVSSSPRSRFGGCLPVHHQSRPSHNLLITIRHCSLASPGCRAYHHNMRTGALIFTFVLTLACYLGFRMQLNARTAEMPLVETCELRSPSAPAPAKIDFATHIKPIFEGKCQPCHFKAARCINACLSIAPRLSRRWARNYLLASRTRTNAV